MKVLVACEESQTVCKAFRAKGHEAYSCDILPPSGGHPEWHIQGDVLPLLKKKWDLIIAHPPCTYLTNAGAVHLYPKGKLNTDRLILGLTAKQFFMEFLESNCDRVCVENPIPSKIFELPPYTQTIQPYQFGHPYSKKTCLWLKGLPPLKPTKVMKNYQSTKIAGNWFNKGGKDRQKNRSKFWTGIANAMADQWSDLLPNQE